MCKSSSEMCKSSYHIARAHTFQLDLTPGVRGVIGQVIIPKGAEGERDPCAFEAGLEDLGNDGH